MAAQRPHPPLLAKVISSAEGKTEDVAERIIGAAGEQISDFGVRRFTIDALAKRVGLSRVTIYRYFPSKDKVLEAVLFHELHRLMGDIEQAVARYDELDRKAVEGFVLALSALRNHRLLQRLLRTEPELLLPLLTTSGAPVVDAAREFIAGFSVREAERGGARIPGSQLAVLSELLARLIISFVLTPESAMALGTEAEMRAFAEEYIGTVVRAFSDIRHADQFSRETPDRPNAPGGARLCGESGDGGN